MELNVKYVRFELENCQRVTVRIDNLERFELEGICENDGLMPCVRKNVIDRTWRCKKMTVCISKEADKKIEFWDKVDGFTNFERLTAYNDIVSITYLDDSGLDMESIYLPWKDEVNSEGRICDTENANQSSRLDDDGNLLIVVEEK